MSSHIFLGPTPLKFDVSFPSVFDDATKRLVVIRNNVFFTSSLTSTEVI
jgi:hypothetical protein